MAEQAEQVKEHPPREMELASRAIIHIDKHLRLLRQAEKSAPEPAKPTIKALRSDIESSGILNREVPGPKGAFHDIGSFKLQLIRGLEEVRDLDAQEKTIVETTQRIVNQTQEKVKQAESVTSESAATVAHKGMPAVDTPAVEKEIKSALEDVRASVDRREETEDHVEKVLNQFNAVLSSMGEGPETLVSIQKILARFFKAMNKLRINKIPDVAPIIQKLKELLAVKISPAEIGKAGEHYKEIISNIVSLRKIIGEYFDKKIHHLSALLRRSLSSLKRMLSARRDRLKSAAISLEEIERATLEAHYNIMKIEEKKHDSIEFLRTLQKQFEGHLQKKNVQGALPEIAEIESLMKKVKEISVESKKCDEIKSYLDKSLKRLRELYSKRAQIFGEATLLNESILSLRDDLDNLSSALEHETSSTKLRSLLIETDNTANALKREEVRYKRLAFKLDDADSEIRKITNQFIKHIKHFISLIST